MYTLAIIDYQIYYFAQIYQSLYLYLVADELFVIPNNIMVYFND